MTKEFFWIHKDVSSHQLGRSLGKVDTEIRRHVQSGKGFKKRNTEPAKHVAGREKSSCRRTSNFSIWLYNSEGMSSDIEGLILQARQRADQYRLRQSLMQALHVRPLYGLDLTSDERRGLNFFITHTAVSWSGWQDESFWTCLALGVGQYHAGIAHGLISLAALHEFRLCDAGRNRHQLLRFSLMQRDKAIQLCRGSADITSHLTSLVSCLVLLCLQNAHHGHHSFHILHSGTRLLGEMDGGSETSIRDPDKSNELKHMRLLFGRIEGRLCMMIDPVASLMTVIKCRIRQKRSVDVVKSLNLPHSFATLSEARDALEAAFEWAVDCYCTPPPMILPAIRTACESWIGALDRTPLGQNYAGSEQRFVAAMSLLKAACLFGIVILETLSQDSELAFDQYEDLFEEILDLVDCARRPETDSAITAHISFGIDDGLVDILAFIGVRCRHPILRRRAIDMLLVSGRREGGRLFVTAGILARAVMEEEEWGVASILSSADISEHKRRRIVKGEQYFSLGKICLTTLRKSESVELEDEWIREQCWVDLPNKIEALDPQAYLCQSHLPDTVFETGCVRFVSHTATREYQTIQCQQFYFPMPRA